MVRASSRGHNRSQTGCVHFQAQKGVLEEKWRYIRISTFSLKRYIQQHIPAGPHCNKVLARTDRVKNKVLSKAYGLRKKETAGSFVICTLYQVLAIS
jgi:hypothetical protein